MVVTDVKPSRPANAMSSGNAACRTLIQQSSRVVIRAPPRSARRIERGPSRGEHASPSSNEGVTCRPSITERQISRAHAVMAVWWGSPGGGSKSNCARVPSTRWRTTRTSAVFSMVPADPVTVMRGGREIGAANDVSMAAVAPDANSAHALKASSASHVCRRPSASGRSGIVTQVRAPPAVTSPRSHRIMSMTWEPNAPIHPPPRERSKSQP